MGYNEYDHYVKRKREILILCAIVSVIVGDFLTVYSGNSVWMFGCLMFASLMTTFAMHGYITNIYFNIHGKVSGRIALWV